MTTSVGNGSTPSPVNVELSTAVGAAQAAAARAKIYASDASSALGQITGYMEELTNAADTATAKAAAAAASASAASGSASSAATSATTATTGASSASASASAAATSEANASNSATSASGSASAAATSATNASNSATAAAASAAAAATWNPVSYDTAAVTATKYYLKTEHKSDGTANAPAMFNGSGGMTMQGAVTAPRFVAPLTAATDGAIVINPSASLYGFIRWQRAGASRYWFGLNNSDDTFAFYSDVATANVWTVSTSNVVAFTQTPTAPTKTAGTNDTSLATTAFVLANAAWVQVGSWSYSSAVSTIDFTGLGSYSEIMICFININSSSGSAANLLVRLSSDGGASYYSASYQGSTDHGATAVTGGLFIGSTYTTSSLCGVVMLSEFNKSIDTICRSSTHYGGAPYGDNYSNSRYTASTAMNALRLLNSSGNFTAGNIRVYGRN